MESIFIIDKYRKASEGLLPTDEMYKGLRIHTINGLHFFLAGKIREYLEKGSRVVDLGAGSGDMSLRLVDMGYTVEAVDIVPENFRLHGQIPFVIADLNHSFSHAINPKCDSLIATEIIEHLENPRSFFRECHKLLKPSGILIISTPNIDCPVSKASFIRDGTYLWFTDKDYSDEGHITPISQWMLKKIISESGYILEWMGTFGDPFIYTTKWWKIRLFARFIRKISHTRKDLSGEILVAILRKSSDSV